MLCGKTSGKVAWVQLQSLSLPGYSRRVQVCRLLVLLGVFS